MRVLEFVNKLELQEFADREMMSEKVAMQAEEIDSTPFQQPEQNAQIQSQVNQDQSNIMNQLSQGG